MFNRSRKFVVLFVCQFLFIGLAIAQPANDEPCNAIGLTLSSSCSYATYTTTGATSSAGVSDPTCGSYSGGDVWFTAVVPPNGNVKFDTRALDFYDGAMEIYSGTCSSLSYVDCNDDATTSMPSITAYLPPGSTVWIRVWAFGSFFGGRFDICFTEPIPAQGCPEAKPFCTGSTYSFPAAVEVPDEGGKACLGSSPNPAWYYLNIATSGAISIDISMEDVYGAGQDVDFICYGPYSSLASACSNQTGDCPGPTTNSLSDNISCTGNVVDCSFSGSNTEICGIENAVSGEWYMLLLTNFSNVPADITFSQGNFGAPGSGTTNCDILCTMTGVTASPGPCDPSNNTYNLSGEISFRDQPSSGTLSVSNSCGGTQSFNAPFSSPTSYTITGVAASGEPCTVTASFSEAPSCTIDKDFIAPDACTNSCAISSISTNVSACDSATNTYSIGGAVIYTNAPNAGSLIIKNDCGDSLLFAAPFTSPSNFQFDDLNPTDGNCSVRAFFTVDPACMLEQNYTAPAPCLLTCGISNITCSPSACDPISNTYSLDGEIVFTNAPNSGTLLINNNCGDSLLFDAPFSSPLNYQFADLHPTNGNCNLSVVFSEAPSCIMDQNYIAPAACPLSCGISNFIANPSACDPTTNTYSIDGEVSFANAPNSGTLTISNNCGESLSLNAPFTSPSTYQFTDLDPTGGACTLTASFSENPACTMDQIYTAPAPCLGCSLSDLTAIPSACDSASNTFSLTGEITFSNAPSNGTLLISNDCGDSLSFDPPFSSPFTYTILDLNSHGGACNLSVVFSEEPACSVNKTYPAASPCPQICGITAVTANPTLCDAATNSYSLSGTISFIYPPNTGTLILTNDCGESQSFNAPFSSPLTYEYVDLHPTGGSCNLNATFSDAPTCTLNQTYSSPAACPLICTISSIKASPSICDAATNSYSLSGSISFVNAPNSGTLILNNDCGESQTFNAPFSSPINYQYTDLKPTGATCNLSAFFTDAPSCKLNQTYTSPAACNSCPIIANNNGPVCTGQTINLSATTIPQATYSWTGPNGFSANGTNVSINNASKENAGSYIVSIQVSSPACTSSSSTIVEVNQPQTSFQFTPENAGTIYPVIHFSGNASGVDDIWSWDFGDGEKGDTKDPIHTYPSEVKTYTVMLQVGSDSCNATATREISIGPEFTFYMPNAFSPNNDEINDEFGAFSEGIIEYDLFIFNRWGEQLFHTTNPAGRWKGDYMGETCEIGLYIWKVNLTDIFKKEHSYVGTVILTN